MNKIDMEKVNKAMIDFQYNLFCNEGSSHFDLLTSFVNLVVSSGWCGKDEIIDALDEYKYFLE